MENVVDLVQVKFIEQWKEIQFEIEQMGYTNYTFTMNAKNYGVAQNRDRVFMVSILGKYYYEQPKPILLEKRLKDYLEPNVDQGYYLSDTQITNITKWKSQQNPLENALTNESNHAPTLLARGSDSLNATMVLIKEATVNGFYKQALDTLANNDVKYGDSISAYNQTVDKSGCSPTITTRPEGKKTAILPITQDLRIRKLTPRECWRLMGIDDSYFDKASQVVSKSQLYKQAGNGIVVDVFAHILKELL